MTMIDKMVDIVPAHPLADVMFGGIASRALASQAFVFDGNAKTALAQLAHAGPKSLAACIPLCRLPFDTCWLEWPGAAVNGINRTENGKPIPTKIGVLLERMTDVKTIVRCSFIWEHGDRSSPSWQVSQGLELCGVSLHVDWSEKPEPSLTGIARKTGAIDPEWARTEQMMASARALIERCVASPSPYFEPFFNLLRQRGQSGQVDRIIKCGQDDVVGELWYVMSALCLLNSRNCVEVQPVDLSKLNKARSRAKKRPLVSYSTVKITLSRSDQRVAEARGMTREQIRQHVVRGHFKIKKNGIYWWRPHLRGSIHAGEVRRDHYEVAPPPAHHATPEATHG